MLRLYDALWHLALPWVVMRLVWRSRRQPAYRQRLGERLGRLPPSVCPGGVWIHAVSAGEAIAAAPLVDGWLTRHPTQAVTLTTATPSGEERIRALLGTRVACAWMPLDLAWAVRAALDRLQPQLVVLIETELWPNLIAACHQRGIAVAVVGARLSERSARRYARGGAWVRRMLAQLALIGSQDTTHAQRFADLGARPDSVRALGSLKQDPALAPAPAFERERLGLGARHRVVVAGSTHRGEEDALLDAFLPHFRADPALCLILAPRHPERAAEVHRVAGRRGLSVAMLSEAERGAGAAVLVVERLGALAGLYAVADVVFVGGSLVAHGGHNPLEPARQGRSILCGPYVANFARVCEQLAAAGALEFADDAPATATRAMALLAAPETRASRGAAGRAALTRAPPALASTLDALEALCNERGGSFS